jgi:hypothetical protein
MRIAWNHPVPPEYPAYKELFGARDAMDAQSAKNQKRLPIPSLTAAGTGFKSQIKPQNDINFSM